MNQITNYYTSIVKSKARLARNIPNTFIQHPGIFALRKLEQVQQEQHIRILTRALTTIDLEESPLKNRIQQLGFLKFKSNQILGQFEFDQIKLTLI